MGSLHIHMLTQGHVSLLKQSCSIFAAFTDLGAFLTLGKVTCYKFT